MRSAMGMAFAAQGRCAGPARAMCRHTGPSRAKKLPARRCAACAGERKNGKIMQIVLYEPEIPPNTGNVARLCAASGVTLNLIEPLGFKLEDRYLKRAGLDYWPNVRLQVWPCWSDFAREALADGSAGRLVFTSAKSAEASVPVHHFAFEPHDFLVFGPETRGLPQEILALSPHRVRIPMLEGRVRSINLSTAAGIVLYAALARTGLMEGWA